MKIDGIKGEFAFKALIRDEVPGEARYGGIQEFKTLNGFKLSLSYYFTKEEVHKDYPNREVKWPVEVDSDGFVHVISEEELT